MEGHDIGVGKTFVQIFRDILAVPGVAAEAEDQRPLRPRMIRRDMDAVKRLAAERLE